MELPQGQIRPATLLQRAAAETSRKEVNISSGRRRSAAQPCAPPHAGHHRSLPASHWSSGPVLAFTSPYEAGRGGQGKGQ